MPLAQSMAEPPPRARTVSGRRACRRANALCHQRKRGIGRDVGENLDLRAGEGRGIAGGRAVFGKIGVRDEQHALGVQPGKAAGASAPKHSRVPQTKLCMTSPLFGDSISVRPENM